MSEKDLTREGFARHPVWAWDDDMEGHVPVEPFDPLPRDRATLFIRARFVAASGEELRGYLIGSETFYAVGLFIGGEEFVLNLNLPQMIEVDMEKIRRLLGAPELQLFPLRYADDVGFMRSAPLYGELRL